MYLDLKAGKNLARMLRITEVIDAYSSTIKAGLGAHRAMSGSDAGSATIV
jgi:hypothetical protein